MDHNYDAVAVSLRHCWDGLLIPPDMFWFADFLLRPDLVPVLNRFCHQRQPRSPDYDRFAATVQDMATAYLSPEVWQVLPAGLPALFRQFMALASLSNTKEQLDYGHSAMLAVATSMYFTGAGIVETSRWPQIIPRALADHQVSEIAAIDEHLFTRILRVDPWLSWTQRLRAQFQRDRCILSTLTEDRFGRATRYYQLLCDRINAQQIKPSRQATWRAKQATRRSILRATKLYSQFYGTGDVQRFLAGETLTFHGTRYDYRVRRSRDLFSATERRDSGVTPVHLDIHQKNGDYLAPACLVFADTPLIDHLFHLRVMAQNPHAEQKMLDALFIVGISNALFDDPLAAEKGIDDVETAPTTLIANIMLHAGNSDKLRERNAIAQQVYQHANAALSEALRYPDGYVALLQQTARFKVEHYIDAMHDEDDEALLMLRQVLEFFGQSTSRGTPLTVQTSLI
jgi:hypothetical protein